MNYPIMMLVAIFFLLNPLFAYKEIEVKNGGKILGIIKKTGKIPKNEILKVTADEQFCGKTISAEKYVISKNGGIKWAVAYLGNIPKGKPITTEPVIIDNVDCRYEPHVAVAPQGGTLKVLNSDPLSNTAHFYLQMKKKRKSIINISLPKF